MAFTSLQTLLPLAVVISVAQSFFPPSFPGLPLQSPFSAASGGAFNQGFNNLRGLDPFQQGRGPKGPNDLVYTMRAENEAGDYVVMTLRPGRSSGNQIQGIFGPISPISRALTPVGQMDITEVEGTFIKGGSSAGVPVPGSLNGVYSLMLFENGNTAAKCIGVGKPYIARKNRRINPQFGPLGPFSGLVNAGNPFFQRTPFQPEYVKLSVPINARFSSSSIHGTLNVDIREAAGRSMVMCNLGNPTCHPPANLCGTVTIDSMSAEEFAQYKRQQQLLREVAVRSAVQGDAAFGGIPVHGIVGGEPEEILTNSNGFENGDLGGGFTF